MPQPDIMLASKQLSTEGVPIITAADTTSETANIAFAGQPSPEEMPTRLRAVIGRLSRHLRPTVAGFDLTPSQVSVLLTVDRHGPLRLTDLAAIESINPTMLSRITGRLTERNLIRRTPDAVDRRAARVESTPAGRRMRRRITRERTAALERHLRELGPDDQAALLAALPALERLARISGEGNS